MIEDADSQSSTWVVFELQVAPLGLLSSFLLLRQEDAREVVCTTMGMANILFPLLQGEPEVVLRAL